MSLNTHVLALVLACGALLASAPAAAQQTESRILGTVTDQNGGTLPGVTVTVTAKSTGAVRTVVSDEMGRYVITNLGPGVYQVSIELTGFAPKKQDVTLGVGDVRPVGVALEVAGLSESVTVAGNVSVVDTSSARIGVNVSPEEIANLPVNGRNFANLMTLATGATTDGNGGWASVRFNGKSNQQNYLNYDGVDGTYVWDASPGYLAATGSQFRLQTSMESIAEFRVNSGLAPAESGLGAGGNITVVSKSGSNRFNGSLFEYLRNDAMDSASKYDDKKQPLEMNQFGGSIGGPLLTNKTFFFGSYEGLKQTTGISFTEAVPSDEAIRRITAGEPVGTRQRTERRAHAGRGAAAGRLPARHGRDVQPAAGARHAGDGGQSERAQRLVPPRPAVQQQPVVVPAGALQQRRRQHAGSDGHAAPGPRQAAAAQRGVQSPVDRRRPPDQRGEARVQPAAVQRRGVRRQPGLRPDAGLALRHRDLAVDRCARLDRHRAQRPARPRDEQRVHQRPGLQPAVDLPRRRAHLEQGGPHGQVRRRVPEHRIAVPVSRQHRDHLQRHQRVHRQPSGADRGEPQLADVHAAAGTT